MCSVTKCKYERNCLKKQIVTIFSFKEFKKFHFAMIVSLSVLEMKVEMNAEVDRSILGGSVNCEIK